MSGRVDLGEALRARDKCFAADAELPADSCATAYPPYSTPRLEAGAPLRNDNLRCALKPLSRGNFTSSFTDDDWALILHAFPSGVCDWSRPAPGQVPSATWLTYATGPGGTPLPVAPTSRALRRALPGITAAPGSGGSAPLPATGGGADLSLVGVVVGLAGLGLVRHRRRERS